MPKLLSGRRVLVVEDEILILMMIEDMLADLGCEAVTAAATVDQALASITSLVFDAAMLDINLGGTNSEPVALALAAHNVPFVLCTGNGGPAAGSGGHSNRPILKKPFKYEDLVETLARLLASSTSTEAPAH